MTTLIADTETNDLLPKLNTIWCLGIQDNETKERVIYSDHKTETSQTFPSLQEGIDRLNAADRVVFHNGYGFDALAFHKLGHDVRVDNIWDTLIASRLYNPDLKRGHSLKAWGSFLKKEKINFSDYDQFTDAMVEYLHQDLVVGGLVYDYLSDRMKDWEDALELEFKTAWIIEQQKKNGFMLDVPKAKTLAAKLTGEFHEIQKSLQDIFPPIWVSDAYYVPKRPNKSLGYSGEYTGSKEEGNKQFRGYPMTKVKLQVFNPGSNQQIESRLKKKYGWKPKEYTPSGQAKIDETILGRLKYPEAKAVAKYKKIEKKLGMLAGDKGWLAYVNDKGRVHGNVNTLGAVTGRMTHSKPNVAQADSAPEMRELWIPRKGWKLAGIDAEGLELRLLGHYLARYDNGKFWRAVVEGRKEDRTDAHSINQDIVGLFYRDSAKTFIYALIYGAGDWKLGMIVIEDALKKGVRLSGHPAKIGANAREKIEKGITGFGKLVRLVKQKATKQKYLGGLDGRRLRVRSAHAALNSLLQGAGAIVMKKALVLFDESVPTSSRINWAYCANVHDEVQIEAHPDVVEHLADKFKEAIVQAGIDLKVRAPLAGSSAIGDNWSQTH